MKQRIPSLCAFLAAISFILILLISSIDFNCFQHSFYEREYAAMNTAQDLHMSHNDLMKATETLLDYLQDKRADIKAEITVSGWVREAFNEREILHMVDVKNLYQFALTLRITAIGCLAVSLLLLWRQKKQDMFMMLAAAYGKCAIGFLCFVAMMGIWAFCDFTGLWESFHRLFFRNDLWLLNPRTDLMINMFPEDFFFHMVIRIAVMFLIGFGGMAVWSGFYWKRRLSIAAQKEAYDEGDHSGESKSAA